MKKILIALFLLSPVALAGQDGTGLRTGITLKKDITGKLGAGFEFQTRFNGDISYLQSYLAEAGLSYEFIKGLELSAYYRYMYRRKNIEKDFKERHRYYADLSYGRKAGLIKLEYRLRYQHQFKDNDLGESEFDNSYLRNKLEVAYAGKVKLRPYVSADVFYEIGNGINQLRPKIGVDYKINKKHKIDLSVFKDIDLATSEKLGAVIGVGYTYKL